MKNLLEVDDSIIRDISREPKVKRKNAPREVTHTITLVPPHYIETLWEDVKHHVAKAVVRSKGRWTLDSLKEALIKQTYSTVRWYEGINFMISNDRDCSPIPTII